MKKLLLLLSLFALPAFAQEPSKTHFNCDQQAYIVKFVTMHLKVMNETVEEFLTNTPIPDYFDKEQTEFALKTVKMVDSWATNDEGYMSNIQGVECE